jgi:hypothetical protein
MPSLDVAVAHYHFLFSVGILNTQSYALIAYRSFSKNKAGLPRPHPSWQDLPRGLFFACQASKRF